MDSSFIAVFTGIAGGVLLSSVLTRLLERRDHKPSHEPSLTKDNIVSSDGRELTITVINDAELPKKFNVESGELSLSFERVDKELSENDYPAVIEQLKKSGYVEIDSNEVSSILTIGLEREFLNSISKKNHKNMNLAIVGSTFPVAATGSLILKSKNGLYTLSRKLQGQEILMKYSDGTYSSMIQNSDGKIVGHVGFTKLDHLKVGMLMTFLWQLGNFIFGTINLYQINQTLKKLLQSVEMILEKLSVEKVARLKTLQSLLVELLDKTKFNQKLTPMDYFELKMYRKEALELYNYYLSEIELISTKELRSDKFLTARKLDEIISFLNTSRVFESCAYLVISLKILKYTETLMLNIMFSIDNSEIVNSELFHLLKIFENDEYIKLSAKQINSLRMKIINSLNEIYQKAVFKKEEVLKHMSDIENSFSKIESEISELEIKSKEMNQKLQQFLSKKMDIVLLVESGRVRVFSKILD